MSELLISFQQKRKNMFAHTFFTLVLLFVCILPACKWSASNEATAKNFEETRQLKLDSIAQFAQEGDLMLRLGDDFTSDRIKNMSIKDRHYSHAGILVYHNGKKQIAHILPTSENTLADTIVYSDISDFFDIKHNLSGAWYRYNFDTNEEAKKMSQIIDSCKQHNMHFDLLYDTATLDKMYCSELIHYALFKSTNGRIKVNSIPVPKFMKIFFTKYFEKYGGDSTEGVVNSRYYYPIDELYMNDHCKKMIQIELKQLNFEEAILPQK